MVTTATTPVLPPTVGTEPFGAATAVTLRSAVAMMPVVALALPDWLPVLLSDVDRVGTRGGDGAVEDVVGGGGAADVPGRGDRAARCDVLVLTAGRSQRAVGRAVRPMATAALLARPRFTVPLTVTTNVAPALAVAGALTETPLTLTSVVPVIAVVSGPSRCCSRGSGPWCAADR